MFVIKYDKYSMIQLVKSIEKYPAIYNNKKHFCKDDIEFAWDNVAKEVGEKDSLCRERWHSLKSCYIRHLKYTALNSKRKAYYLAEYMEFLRPFVIDRLKKFVNFQSSQVKALPAYLKEGLSPSEPINKLFSQSGVNIIDQGTTTTVKEEVVEIDDVAVPDWYSAIEDQPSTSSTTLNTPEPSELRNRTSKKKKTDATTSIINDPDASFFRGILPDIGRMSNHQKLKFKQEVLSIIEDILYATEEIDVTM